MIYDAVNLSARLETLTKQYPNCKILMNDLVHEQLDGKLATCYIGEEQVRGKRQAVRVYGILEEAIP